MAKRSRLLPLLVVAAVWWLTGDALWTLGTAFQAPARVADLRIARLHPLSLKREAWAGAVRAAVPSLVALRKSGGREATGLVAGFAGNTEERPASWHLAVAATALAAASASPSVAVQRGPSAQVLSALKLPVFVMLWYFFNVQYNIQNKMLLKVFPATYAVAFFQLAAGIPVSLLLWASGSVRMPGLTASDLRKLAPVGAAFVAGHCLTVASLGASAVSFTHVVKALEPAVNALASAVLLGQVFHPVVYASLAPVFLGVALASSSDLSFTPFGFFTAMASNFAFVTRNVLATKLGSVGDMGDDPTERKTNQLAVLTFVATLVMLPVALLVPGGLTAVPAAWQHALSKGLSSGQLLYMLATTGFYFFMYQMSSFWVLSQVPPITHSVLNTLKRCVIIIMSIFIFGTPVTRQSVAGTSMAIGGVLLYSLVKRLFATKGK